MSGFFISFEGSEGCGKSTQIRRLIRHFEGAGVSPLLVREPGGTAIGEKIRHLLQHDPEASAMCPETELLLFAASRAQLVREIIAPALAAGRTVIADRFLDSTTVYQGVARRLDPEAVARINRFAAGGRLPDITFVLDMDPALAMARLEQGGGSQAPADRMESQPPEFYRSVREGYLDLARREPARVRLLDASRSEEAVFADILAALPATTHGSLERIRA
ncbi:MAG: dTMP kinase [Terrimicrobiaceae bacterium]|nr:dTMP kinase [Terrimicrobiaceae bacterium]